MEGLPEALNYHPHRRQTTDEKPQHQRVMATIHLNLPCLMGETLEAYFFFKEKVILRPKIFTFYSVWKKSLFVYIFR